MKIFAHYDSTGTIRSLVAMNAPEEAGMMLAPKPGIFVAEVEGLKLKTGQPEVAAVREITDKHRIATPLPRHTLLKRQ